MRWSSAVYPKSGSSSMRTLYSDEPGRRDLPLISRDFDRVVDMLRRGDTLRRTKLSAIPGAAVRRRAISP